MRAILIEFHRWRGCSRGRDLFDWRGTAGFVTVYRHRVSIAGAYRVLRADRDGLRARARALAEQLRKLTAGVKAAVGRAPDPAVEARNRQQGENDGEE